MNERELNDLEPDVSNYPVLELGVWNHDAPVLGAQKPSCPPPSQPQREGVECQLGVRQVVLSDQPLPSEQME